MDPFIRAFTASQLRGAAAGCALCGPLVSFLTNLRCRDLTLEHAVIDGVLTSVCIALTVAPGSEFVFRYGMKKNPWFKLEDHPLGECSKLLELLPRSNWGIGGFFALSGAAVCAIVLYLIFSVAAIETISFGTFIIFKLIFTALLGATTARFAALNNFRYK
ncbi:MAG: hypothetical protein IKA87_07845 [Lentisphaeria bacterium]|nr:hypothetical protein [Lentisphaeria bacterium]